mmetsp:Transcript_33227/g.72499  ORF Transcript_33227/g.72499 Transcript_33227/m.72499 type:complete len:516 (+) Transcript_33227:29-1576(+)
MGLPPALGLLVALALLPTASLLPVNEKGHFLVLPPEWKLEDGSSRRSGPQDEGGLDDPRYITHKEVNHEHTPSTESAAVSMMLVGAVVFNICLFYLFNFPDVDIRAQSWKVLSMTVSIFSAVLLYTSMKALLMEVLSVSSGTIGRTILNLALFLVLFVTLQVALFFLKRKDQRMQLAAASRLVAHLAGFSAMYGFAGLQTFLEGSRSNLLSAILTTAAATVSTVGLALIASTVRNQIAMADDGVIDDDEEEWMDEVRDAENDVLSLSLGFLVMQCVRCYIAGELQPYKPPDQPLPEITQAKTNQLLLWGTFFAGMTFISTWLVGRLKRYEEGSGGTTFSATQSDHAVDGLAAVRYAKVGQNVFAMAMAWTFLFWGEWQIYTAGFNGQRITGCLFLALGLLCLSLVFVFVLDAAADREMLDPEALRSLILALGVLVGISWEKAFHVSVEEVAHIGTVWGLDRALTCHMLGVSLAFLVIPAWRFYILPRSLDEGGGAAGQLKSKVGARPSVDYGGAY